MFVSAESFSTTLVYGINALSYTITIPINAAAILSAAGVDASNYTELAISDGVSFEIVRTTNLVGDVVFIARAQAGTIASTFPPGATVRFVWTANGVQEEAAQVGASVSFTSNIANAITGGPAVFNVDFPVYSAGANLVLTGIYPNFTIGLDPGYSPAGTGITSVSGSTDFVIADPTTTPTFALSTIFPTPSGGNIFGAGLGVTGSISGIRVSNTGRIMEVASTALPNGSYTNATITVANGIISGISTGAIPDAPDASGTVTIVNAGTGITVSGVPSATPTVGITNTGVSAGTYEGVQINAQGQFVAVPSGFGPISSITTSSAGITIANAGTGIRSINIAPGTDATPGLVEYVDNADAINFALNNKAYDPVRLKYTLNYLGRRVSQILTAGSLTGPALTTVLQTVVVTGGDYILVTANVVFSDPTAGADEYNQSFSIGIYVGGVAHTVLPAFKSGMKSISTIVSSFLGGNIELRCTTPAGAQVTSSKLSTITLTSIP